MWNKFLKTYKLKSRSLPRFENITRYGSAFAPWLILLALFYMFRFLLTDYDPLAFPSYFLVFVPMIFFATYYKLEADYASATKDDMADIVYLIRINHIQSLTEALEEKPEMLARKYKQKSLVYWAKHYNNLEAHSLIVKMMKAK